MINPLKVASDGYLKAGVKLTLTIAVAGYLSVGSTPQPPIIPTQPPTYSGFGGGTGQGYTGITWSQTELLAKQKKLTQEDQEILLIIKCFLDAID